MNYQRRTMYYVLVLLTCAAVCRADDVCQLFFLNVGYGAAIIVRHANTTLLIDGGTSDQWQRTVRPFLQANALTNLAAVICTHAHEDHCGGLVGALDELRVAAFYRPVWRATNNYTRALDALIRARRIPHGILARGMTCTWGRLHLHVLNPPAGGADVLPPPVDLNATSLGCVLLFGAARALLLADMTVAAQAALPACCTNAPVALLQVPHHGAADAFCPALFEGVAPRHAVLSVGANPYGYPSPAVVTEYRARTRLWRTDEQGTIIATLDAAGDVVVTCVPPPTAGCGPSR